MADHDQGIQTLFEAIRRLIAPPETQRKQTGFMSENAANNTYREAREEAKKPSRNATPL